MRRAALLGTAVWKDVMRWARAAGIEDKTTPHSTRRTPIMLALDGGVPLNEVRGRRAMPTCARRNGTGAPDRALASTPWNTFTCEAGGAGCDSQPVRSC